MASQSAAQSSKQNEMVHVVLQDTSGTTNYLKAHSKKHVFNLDLKRIQCFSRPNGNRFHERGAQQH